MIEKNGNEKSLMKSITRPTSTQRKGHSRAHSRTTSRAGSIIALRVTSYEGQNSNRKRKHQLLTNLTTTYFI
jgi:hypothetical protein